MSDHYEAFRDVARPAARKPTLAGRIVKNIREDIGVTQKDMAELFGFGINTIYQWERGLARPSFDDIHMICEFYGRKITTEINKIMPRSDDEHTKTSK